jgi:hypothetical protein
MGPENVKEEKIEIPIWPTLIFENILKKLK